MMKSGEGGLLDVREHGGRWRKRREWREERGERKKKKEKIYIIEI